MNKGVHIKEKTNSVNYNINKCFNPAEVYIPLEDKNGLIYEHIVHEGDYVYKGQIIAKSLNNDFCIHSSVSGYAEIGTRKNINTGKKIRCVVIKNDFKEMYEKSKMKKISLDNYTNHDFIEDLKINGIAGLGGSGFPTFIKYNNKLKYLIVNGVECEPFVYCDKAIIYNYSEKILSCIDNIINIMKLKNAFIVLKDSNLDGIKAINSYIKMYPNIKLKTVKDTYPAGWERSIIKNILNIEYDKYPSEKGIVVNNVSTIYSIYEMFNYNRPLIERVITINGPGIKKKCNIRVKIGTLASDLIMSLDGYNKMKNPIFILGGPMMGKSLPSDDVIITKDVSSILVIDDKIEKNLPCVNCGKCLEVCPVGLCPVLIMKNIDNIEILRKLHPEKCIECGLCSFTCPSKIEVREYVRMAKEKVSTDEKI